MSLVGDMEFEKFSDREVERLKFMAKGMNCDRFIFIGYNRDELERWGRSHGSMGDGSIKVGVEMTGALAARAIAHILLDFPWSDGLRREVHHVLNMELTDREKQRNIDAQRSPEGD